MHKAYINRIAEFLPNDRVENDQMETYLGVINQTPSKSKAIVLRSNKIEGRYYALDETGKMTHSNAEMAANAVRNLFKENPEEIKSMDLLTVGTSMPDQMMPSHAIQVHGYLPETGAIEVTSAAGVCCSGMHALKYAYLSVRSGEKERAVSSASERLSGVLRADQFEEEVQKLIELEEKPYLAFDKDFLRWMLSDGAGAFLVESEPNKDGISLEIDWMEAVSYANEVEPCMYAGSDKMSDGTLKSYKDYTPEELQNQSILSIKQDVKLLSENIVRLGFTRFKEIMDEKGMSVNEIDHFLPHISSFFFEDKIADFFDERDMHIPKEKWFTNLKTKGNVGAASIYLMLGDLMNGGTLKKGEKIILAVPESSRFSYVFTCLTVC